MKRFLEEFKTFAIRGNVVDLAVAVVVGAAFGKIVTSLVNSIVMPLVGLLIGGINFSDLSLTVGKAVITYGVFIQTVVDFIIIAFAVFIAVRIMNKLQEREAKKPEKEKTVTPSEEILLLREIRDSVKK